MVKEASLLSTTDLVQSLASVSSNHIFIRAALSQLVQKEKSASYVSKATRSSLSERARCVPRHVRSGVRGEAQGEVMLIAGCRGASFQAGFDSNVAFKGRE